MTQKEWELLMGRLERIEGKMDQINGIRLWRARVNGAIFAIGFILTIVSSIVAINII